MEIEKFWRKGNGWFRVFFDCFSLFAQVLAHISLFNRCSLHFKFVKGIVEFCWDSDECWILLQLGSTAIGVKTKEGVVLAVEKRITSPLLVCLLTLNSMFFRIFLVIHYFGTILNWIWWYDEAEAYKLSMLVMVILAFSVYVKCFFFFPRNRAVWRRLWKLMTILVVLWAV